MIKRVLALILLITLAAGLTGAAPVMAAGGITVTSSSAEVNFPMTITFDIAARSSAEITDIRLDYTIERRAFARVVGEFYMYFTPSTSVETDYTWDMRMTGGLPPGAQLQYWWRLTDAAGDSLTTDPVTVVINDERYDWNSLTEGEVTLYWYEGDDAFAAELMATTQTGLIDLEADTGAVLDEPVKFYVYASSADLQGAMIYPQEWTGGVAFTEYGTIVIGITPTTSGLDWGKGAIVHELTHLVIHQVIANPYSGLPTWLDEGLAMVSMGELSDDYVEYLDWAILTDQLISVRSLSSPFSTYASESVLAYAQSYELVKYLLDNYGRDNMSALLDAFKEGSGYDEALLAVYGFDRDGLDSAWRATLQL